MADFSKTLTNKIISLIDAASSDTVDRRIATTDLGKKRMPLDQRYHPHDMEQGRTMREMKNPLEKKGHRQKSAKLSTGALRQIKVKSAKLLLHSGDVSQPDYN